MWEVPSSVCCYRALHQYLCFTLDLLACERIRFPTHLRITTPHHPLPLVYNFFLGKPSVGGSYRHNEKITSTQNKTAHLSVSPASVDMRIGTQQGTCRLLFQYSSNVLISSVPGSGCTPSFLETASCQPQPVPALAVHGAHTSGEGHKFVIRHFLRST